MSTVIAVALICGVGVISQSPAHVTVFPETAEASTTPVVSNETAVISTAAVADSAPVVVVSPTPSVEPVVVKPVSTKPDPRPRNIKIPSIGLDREIVDVGVTETNNLDVPPNYTQVGWYKDGHVPGEWGSTVLDGHVDNGFDIPGPFKYLRNVKIGDAIVVTAADGTPYTYKVTSAVVYPLESFPGDYVFHDNTGSLLKIITCHGTFKPDIDTYDQRLIVTAFLVQ